MSSSQVTANLSQHFHTREHLLCRDSSIAATRGKTSRIAGLQVRQILLQAE